jgi:hypothetical protein
MAHSVGLGTYDCSMCLGVLLVIFSFPVKNYLVLLTTGCCHIIVH